VVAMELEFKQIPQNAGGHRICCWIFIFNYFHYLNAIPSLQQRPNIHHYDLLHTFSKRELKNTKMPRHWHISEITYVNLLPCASSLKLQRFLCIH
jgi:hypothetical protein